jgi:hypothetical protein
VVEVGQLRRWRYAHLARHGEHFIVLNLHTVPLPGAAWIERGWYILIDGRQQWVAECDIENDSDLLGERVERDSPVVSDA